MLLRPSPGAWAGADRRLTTTPHLAILLRILAAVALAAPAAAGEVCTYAGTTEPTGQVGARAEASLAPDGTIRVDVAVDLRARVGWFWDVRYLAREVSSWRDGQLAGVAVNSRTLSNGRVVRQQWDVFTRGPTGLEARRVQGKTLADFRLKHPRFAQHWDPAAFLQPWAADYDAAAPERRPDLDLPAAALPVGLRTPLAAAFWWTRWLPPAGQAGGVPGAFPLPVFLPGFKRDARADLAALPGAAEGGGRVWHVPLRHPALQGGTESAAEALVGPDRRVLRIALDVHARQGSGSAALRLVGCAGLPPPPFAR